jgi:hypothetical protein
MRRHLLGLLALVVAVATVAVGIASPAGARSPNTTNVQTIEVNVRPKKLPAKQRVPIKITVNVEATSPDGSTPNATSRALVDFDKDLRFQQKGYPTCDPSQFGSQSTTQDVRDQCPDSIVGSGTATVVLGALTIGAQTIGANVRGNSLLLHSYTQQAGGVPLVGKFKKSNGGRKYGQMLDVPVPPLAGGSGVITQFGLNAKRISYRMGRKRLAIVSARCRDRKLDFQARFTDEFGHVAVGKDTVTCTKQRTKKRTKK